MTPLLYAIAAALLGFVLWIAVGVRRIGAVSRGDPIRPRPETALLLIDLQTVFWDNGPYAETEKAEAMATILEEIAAARARGRPVIAVRQEWSIPSTKLVARLLMKGQAIEGTPGTEIAAPFAGLSEHVLVKRVQDAFETGDLDKLLAELNVGRLRLVGLDLNYCVLKAALGARARGYDVVVVQRGTLAAGSTSRARGRLDAAGVMLDGISVEPNGA